MMLLAKTYWQLIASVAAIAGFFIVVMVHDAKVEKRGADKAVAKIEKATTNAANKGASAARKSLASGVRGQRDPTTRDD